VNASAGIFLLIALTVVPGCRGTLLGRSSAKPGDNAPKTQSEQHVPADKASSPRPGLTTLRFSGYDWIVKSSKDRVGPGPNYFSDDKHSVFVDDRGRLHLLITHRDGHWYCAEVISTNSFGYGTYRFELEGNIDKLDPQIVLGMFTWNDAAPYNHREIDIEVSRWGQDNNQNAQFVVQPYTRVQNIVRFQIPAGLSSSIHSFTWTPNSVFCQSVTDIGTNAGDASQVVQRHTFTHDVPQAGGENARINLWLMAGRAPNDGRDAEIIIRKFEFTALQP